MIKEGISVHLHDGSGATALGLFSGPLDSCDPEAFGLQESPDFIGLIALELDPAFFDGSAASARFAKFLGELLNEVEADVRGEVVHHDNGLTAPMGGFLPQDHPAELGGGWGGGFPFLYGRGGGGRLDLKGGEGVLGKLSGSAGGNSGFVRLGHMRVVGQNWRITS